MCSGMIISNILYRNIWGRFHAAEPLKGNADPLKRVTHVSWLQCEQSQVPLLLFTHRRLFGIGRRSPLIFTNKPALERKTLDRHNIQKITTKKLNLVGKKWNGTLRTEMSRSSTPLPVKHVRLLSRVGGDLVGVTQPPHLSGVSSSGSEPLTDSAPIGTLSPRPRDAVSAAWVQRGSRSTVTFTSLWSQK